MKGSPYIKECVIVAEGQVVGALVAIDYETVGNGPRRSAAVHAFRLLGGNAPGARPHRRRHPHRQRAPAQSQIRVNSTWLTKELTTTTAKSPPLMNKVRCSSIYKTYAEEIEAWYRQRSALSKTRAASALMALVLK